jgi:hypothetical protein
MPQPRLDSASRLGESKALLSHSQERHSPSLSGLSVRVPGFDGDGITAQPLQALRNHGIRSATPRQPRYRAVGFCPLSGVRNHEVNRITKEWLPFRS